MQEFEVAVIGGGFAGLSAALYAARAGAETVVLERAAPGGQILTAGHVENYPGGGVTDGAALAEQLTGQVRAQGVRILGQEVTGISAGCLETDGEQFGFRALILATGAERRRLGVPGEDRFAGRGVSWCAACDGFFFRGKTVAVVGGGNTALEEAVELSAHCAQVYVLFRAEVPRADRVLAERARHRANIRLLPGTVVREICGEQSVTGLVIERDGAQTTLAVDGVFEAIGTVPNTAPVASLLPRGADGGIVTDAACRTAVPGIFAAGDCRSGAVRQLVTAAADGAVAGMLAAKHVGL